MNTLNSIGANAPAGAGTMSSGTGAAAPTARDVQDRFLTLLVTQMKNQDPLNPLDNAQLTTQLAQISTVTGIEQMHQTMKAVLDQIKGLEALHAAGIDGRDVLIASDRIQLSAGGASGAFELTGPADAVTITIKNSAGATLREMQLSRQEAGMHTFEWEGITASGARAADGLYSVSINATASGTPVASTTLARAHVSGIVQGADTIQLDLGLLGRRSLNDVREIL